MSLKFLTKRVGKPCLKVFTFQTNSYGSHHSLQDLHKIVANSRLPSTQGQLLETDLDHCPPFSTVEASESKSPVKAVAPLKRGLSSPDALNGDVSSAQSIPPPKVTSTPNFNQGDQIISYLQKKKFSKFQLNTKFARNSSIRFVSTRDLKLYKYDNF